MRGVAVRMTLGVLAGLTVMGCMGDGYKTATTRHLEQIERMGHRSNQHEQDMINNAVMADMSLAEFHFMPHSEQLSGSGVARLDRMAVMLDTYGGTVRYAARMGDDELVEQRIAKVRDYLAMTGCNMDRVKIEPGLSGGSGTGVRRALEKEERMHNPPDQGGGLPPLLGVGSN